MLIIRNKYKRRLDSIKKEVVKQFGKGKPSNWRNRNFEDLSFEINKASKVLISTATLKRIFGKNKTSDNYFPQESTLEAMEKYAGINEMNSKARTTFYSRYLAAAVPILSLIVIVFIVYLITNLNENSEIKAELTLAKIDGANPATVFFNYSIPETEDSLFISFGDEYPLQFLPVTGKNISHYYRYPGNFDVSIRSRKNVVSDTCKLFIPTNDWQALAYYFEQSYKERYFPVPMELATNKDGFHPTRQDLASIGMDTTQIVVLRLDNFKKTNINGDSFTLKTRLKNVSYWPAIRCYSGYIKIIGENGIILIKLTNEGCSQFGEFILSEKSAYGSFTDLTGFSLDIKTWNDIEIINIKQNVLVNINSETIFQESYTKSIGNTLGLSLQFHGSGFVDYFEMFDSENNVIFDRKFSH